MKNCLNNYKRVYILLLSFFLLGTVCTAERVHVLTSFEFEKDLEQWSLTDLSTSFVREIEYATDGLFSAGFLAPGYLRESPLWPGLILELVGGELLTDWSDFNQLCLDYSFIGPHDPGLLLKVTDSDNNSLTRNVDLAKDPGVIRIALEGIDRKKIKNLQLFFTKPGPVDFHLDNLRLEYDPQLILQSPISSKLVRERILINSFETEQDLRAMYPVGAGSIHKRVNAHATEGFFSLSFSVVAYEAGGQQWPGFNITESHGLPVNWSGYELCLDYYNPEKFDPQLNAKIRDHKGNEFIANLKTQPQSAGTIRIPMGAVDTSEIVFLNLFFIRPPQPITIYIDNLRLERKEKGIPLQFSGSYYNKLDYSPENELKTINSLRASTSVNTGGLASVQLRLNAINETSVGFENKNPKSRSLEPWIDRFAIRLRGSLHPNLKPITLLFGKWYLNYSSYLAMFNYDNSILANGLMLEGLRLGSINCNGFVIWEQDIPYRSVGEGIRLQSGSGPWRVETVIVRSLKGNPKVDGEKIVELGKFELREFDMSMQVEKFFPGGGNIKALGLVQRDFEKHEGKPIKAQKVDLEVPLKKRIFNSLKFSYRNFEPGFSPRYRDSTPKITYTSGTPQIRWNPVERFANQKGITGEISFSGNSEGKLYIDYYDKLSQGIFIDLIANIKNPQLACDLYLKKEQGLGPINYFEMAIKYNMKTFMTPIFKYIADQTGNNNDLQYQGSIYELGFEWSMKSNLLKNFSFEAGLQKAAHNYAYFSGKGAFLRNLVQIEFAYRSPNNVENDNYWLDDFGRLHRQDNYFALSTSISF